MMASSVAAAPIVWPSPPLIEFIGSAAARILSQHEGVRENEQIVGTSVVARVVEGPEVIRRTLETRDLTVCCNEAPVAPEVTIDTTHLTIAQAADLVVASLDPPPLPSERRALDELTGILGLGPVYDFQR